MPSYYDKHKPQVLEKARRIVKCECGFEVRYSNLSSHKKSNSHIIWLQGRKRDELQSRTSLVQNKAETD